MDKTISAESLAVLADERIEACIAACEDVDTETLQRHGSGSFALLAARLTRYQEFTHRLFGVLGRVQARIAERPSSVELVLLDTLRVEAAPLLHQETQAGSQHGNH